MRIFNKSEILRMSQLRNGKFMAKGLALAVTAVMASTTYAGTA